MNVGGVSIGKLCKKGVGKGGGGIWLLVISVVSFVNEFVVEIDVILLFVEVDDLVWCYGFVWVFLEIFLIFGVIFGLFWIVDGWLMDMVWCEFVVDSSVWLV